MENDPKTPGFIPADVGYRHRRSIRLKGYYYAQAGRYFITICCHHRTCLFGQVVGGQMILNETGRVADDCWLAIPEHFPNAILYEHVVMPNHVHGIIELTDTSAPKAHAYQKMIPRSIGSIVRRYKTGVTKWFRYGRVDEDANGNGDRAIRDVGAENFLPLREHERNASPHLAAPPVWQRNYHEHIIRDEPEYRRIAHYILRNPENWAADRFRL